MSLLDQVKTGPTTDPLRILLHGQEGVGKTTWATGCPGVLFLSAEDGGGDLNYARLVLSTWKALRAAVKELAATPGPYRVVCIDTIDAFERLLWQDICSAAQVESIELVGGGYGKGYTAAAEKMAELQRDLDTLRSKQGMGIILLGHSHVRPFNDPLGAPYDRYEVRMHKGSADLWKAWADAILFACFDVTVMKQGKKGRVVEAGAMEKGKALEGVKRVVYTSKEAGYDAKNRHNLPEELPLSWKAFSAAIRWDERHKMKKAAPPVPVVAAPPTEGTPTEGTPTEPQAPKSEATSADMADAFVTTLHSRVVTWAGYEHAERDVVAQAALSMSPNGVPLAELPMGMLAKMLEVLGVRTDDQLKAKLATPLSAAGIVPF